MGSTPTTRWRQFSLRGLLLLITLASVLLAWCGWRLQRVRIESKAADAIVEAGGEVAYANQFDGRVSRMTPYPAHTSKIGAWLQQLLGVNPLQRMVSVKLVDDTSLALVSKYSLTGLEIVRLEGSQITDAGLAHIRDCTQVRVLSLDGARVSDGGLDNIRRYKQLEELWLNNTLVSEAGIKKIAHLDSLWALDIRGTSISDEGLTQIASMRGISTLYLNSNTLSDDGLKNLRALPNLHCLLLGDQLSARFDVVCLSEFPVLNELCLEGASVKDATLKPLAGNKKIETLRLHSCTGLTDQSLSIIATMPRLRHLNLARTPFSAQALTQFRTEHPNCTIR